MSPLSCRLEGGAAPDDVNDDNIGCKEAGLGYVGGAGGGIVGGGLVGGGMVLLLLLLLLLLLSFSGDLNIIGTKVEDCEDVEAIVGIKLSSCAAGGRGSCTLLMIRCSMDVKAIRSFPVNVKEQSSTWDDNASTCSYKSFCVFFNPYSR